MEVLVSHLIETKKDGSKIVRNFFFNEDKTNYLVKAQSYFTKNDKKQSRLNSKLSLKSNQIKYKEDRVNLAQHLLKSDCPNWNIKFGFL